MAAKEPKKTPKRYARRKVVRGKNDQLKVVFIDTETGKEVKNVDNYTILSEGETPNDIYFGTDRAKPKKNTSESGTGESGAKDIPRTGAGSSEVYGAKEAAMAADPRNSIYMNNDPAQGLKPKGTILGGIIKNAIKENAPGAIENAKNIVTGAIENNSIVQFGKQFGLFGGNDTVGPDGKTKSTPAIDNILDHGSTGPKQDQAYATPPASTPGPGLNLNTGELEDNAGKSSINWGEYGENLTPAVKSVIQTAQQYVDFPITLSSGYRDADRNKAAGGASQSEHIHGNAVDISLKGLSDGQRTQLVRALNEAGANRLGAYSGNTGLHVDMSTDFEDDPRKQGTVYPMFDKSANNMASAPEWFKAGLTPSAPNPVNIPTSPVPAPPGAPATAMEMLKGFGSNFGFGLGGVVGGLLNGNANNTVAPEIATGDPNSDPVILNYLATINKQEGSPAANQAFDYVDVADLSQHPNIYNKAYDTTAAGLYQINYPTWNEYAPKAGATSFSAADQNKVAWEIAKENFKTRTGGGDLYNTLKSGDPKVVAPAFYMNSNRWASFPKTYASSQALANEYIGMNVIPPSTASDETASAFFPDLSIPPLMPNAKPFSEDNGIDNPAPTPTTGMGGFASKMGGSGNNSTPYDENTSPPPMGGGNLMGTQGFANAVTNNAVSNGVDTSGRDTSKPYDEGNTNNSTGGATGGTTVGGSVGGFANNNNNNGGGGGNGNLGQIGGSVGGAAGNGGGSGGGGFAPRVTSEEEGKKGLGGGQMI